MSVLMKCKFKPRELQNHLKKAISLLEEEYYGCVGIDEEDIYGESKIKPSTLTKEDYLTIYLEDSEVAQITIQQFLEFMDEVPHGKIFHGTVYRAPTRTIRFVAPVGSIAELFSERMSQYYLPVIGNEHLGLVESMPHKCKVGEKEIKLSVLGGFTPFALANVRDMEYEGHYQHPAYSPDDLYIQARHPDDILLDKVDEAIKSFIFELSSSIGFDVRIQSCIDEYAGGFPFENDALEGKRFRPLPQGLGISEVMDLYLKAISLTDLESQILAFVKVLEFVSSTFIRLKKNQQVRSRLLSKSALDPNVDFIEGLRALIENQRELLRDRVSLQHTIKECCDALELASEAPDICKNLLNLDKNATSNEIKKALGELSDVISDTRNSIAHSKASYQPSGNECPPDQYEKLAKCLKIAAQQLIRRYADTEERMRIFQFQV